MIPQAYWFWVLYLGHGLRGWGVFGLAFRVNMDEPVG